MSAKTSSSWVCAGNSLTDEQIAALRSVCPYMDYLEAEKILYAQSSGHAIPGPALLQARLTVGEKRAQEILSVEHCDVAARQLEINGWTS